MGKTITLCGKEITLPEEPISSGDGNGIEVVEQLPEQGVEDKMYAVKNGEKYLNFI